jgi:hypothetical protein
MGPTNPNRQDGGPCLIAALLYAQAVVGFAQPTVSSADLARCAEIAQDVARLACFDTLVQRRGDDRRTESERTANDSAEASSQVENEDAFGAELLGGRETLGIRRSDWRTVKFGVRPRKVVWFFAPPRR